MLLLEQGLGGPTARSSWKIRQNGVWEARRLAGFFDWNTHFVVFTGGVERGLGGLTDRSSKKIRQNGGWEARQLDQTGAFTPTPPPAAVSLLCFLLQQDLHSDLILSSLQLVLCCVVAVKRLPVHHHSADYIFSGLLGSLGSF